MLIAGMPVPGPPAAFPVPTFRVKRGCGIGRPFLPCNAAQRFGGWFEIRNSGNSKTSQEVCFGRTADFYFHNTHTLLTTRHRIQLWLIYWGRGLDLINCISTRPLHGTRHLDLDIAPHLPLPRHPPFPPLYSRGPILVHQPSH